MKELALLGWLAPLLLWAGCGGGAASPPGDGGNAAQVQGNWYLALTSTSIPGSQGEANLFIKQTGKTISAPSLHAYGAWCLQGGRR